MKIDKVLFSCSESAEYAPFWNVQSELYSRHLGIEPICLLFGKKENTSMTEKFGRIIEMPHNPDLPWALQLVWSKFNYPLTEPDTTWLLGDIDLVPLQRAHFTSKIADVPDTSYIHLNAGGIAQPRLGKMDGFMTDGPERLAKDRGVQGGADLPGHYHVAKGRLFELFTEGRGFEDQIRHIVDSDRFGMGVMGAWDKKSRTDNPYWYYWCAEENFSSWQMWHAMRDGKVHFVPVFYNNGNDRDRLNRDEFKNGNYTYSEARAAGQEYVDVHCKRPYGDQADALKRLIEISWGQ